MIEAGHWGLVTSLDARFTHRGGFGAWKVSAAGAASFDLIFIEKSGPTAFETSR